MKKDRQREANTVIRQESQTGLSEGCVIRILTVLEPAFRNLLFADFTAGHIVSHAFDHCSSSLLYGCFTTASRRRLTKGSSASVDFIWKSKSQAVPWIDRQSRMWVETHE